jgi:hypothetical protein
MRRRFTAFALTVVLTPVLLAALAADETVTFYIPRVA